MSESNQPKASLFQFCKSCRSRSQPAITKSLCSIAALQARFERSALLRISRSNCANFSALIVMFFSDAAQAGCVAGVADCRDSAFKLLKKSPKYEAHRNGINFRGSGAACQAQNDCPLPGALSRQIPPCAPIAKPIHGDSQEKPKQLWVRSQQGNNRINAAHPIAIIAKSSANSSARARSSGSLAGSDWQSSRIVFTVHSFRVFVCVFQQNIHVARLSRRAPASQIFPA